MEKTAVIILLALFGPIMASGQRDTISTMLREVAVIGVKQLPETELSSATLVPSSMVKDLEMVTMKDVSGIAPNFYMPDYGSRMTSSMYVRGLGARMDQPVVGLNVDNVPIMNKDGYDFDLFDIERIEMFRGAQSTLNGRNTMGGQINIFTLSPWKFQGVRLMAGYGRGNSLKAGGGWYGRLLPELATSITGYYTMTDGFFRNRYNNGRLDTEKQGSLRWKLSWHPSSRLSITNVASAQITRQGGYPYASVRTGEIAYNDTCFYRRGAVTDGMTVGWTGKRVIVNSITSVQYIDDNMTLDQDFLPVDYFTLTQKRKEWTITEDLFTKGRRGDYSWLGGVFGFYRHSDMDAPVTFKDTGISRLIEGKRNEINPEYPIEWNDRMFTLGSNFTTTTGGGALYHQSTFRWHRFTIEGGLRWDIENATLDYRSHCRTGYTTWHVTPDGGREQYDRTSVDIDDHGRLSETFNEILPKLTVAYSFPSSKVYASVSKGYKAGGFNTQMFSDVLQQRIMGLMGLGMSYDVDDIVGYRPEKSWNYEIGLHSTLAGGRLSLDCAGFIIYCRDQQLTMFPDGTTTGRIMTNAGRTRSFGVELSATYCPVTDLTLRGSYGYTNATFRRFNNGIADYRGNRLPYAPSNTMFISADYVMPWTIAGASLSVNVNVRGVGDIYWDEANMVRQPFYATLDASLSVERGRWSVSFWGENITYTRYDTFYFVSMGNAFVQKADPWTIGATFRLNITNQ